MQRHLIDGRYTLGELLGGGGMAQVFLARDEVLGRDVALKMLRSQYADDEDFVERFRREARNAAALNHPTIVQVYDQGRAEDGTYYIAMEYVPGGTLAQRIKREGPMDPAEAAAVASRVAEALAVAHERGIIHRDIKPQNVLLTASGDAKVADLGIARAASSTTMTETSLIFGTASYMSPEQAKGERVRPQSDLYSLGIVLFQMLTGELPYTADNPLATAMKHVDAPPRHPREVNPAVPQELDAATAKLLAKRPEDRYASAAALAEDLRRVSEGLPPLAAGLEQKTAEMPKDTARTRRSPAAAAPGRRPALTRRSRRRLLLLGAALLVLVLLGGLAWELARESPSGPPPQAAPRVQVPNVVGLSLDEAQGRLGNVGLKLGSRTEAASSVTAAGAVIHQDPTAGSKVERGTAVDVTVSTGPAPAPTTQSSSATSSASSSATAAPTTSTASASASAQPQNQTREQPPRQTQKATKKQQKAQKEAQSEAVHGPKEKNQPANPSPGGKGRKKK
jgi:serine/threonine protein kinase